MCFRPSALHGNSGDMNTATCDKCGQPVVAKPGVQAGECPYCGAPIPATGDGTDKNPQDPTQSTRIL